MRRFLVLPFLLTVACASILGIKEATRGPFEHRAHVLEGLPCTNCHVGVDEAKELGELHLPANDQCVLCHQPPHDPNPCRDCHGEALVPERLALAKKHLKFTHEKHVPEVNGNCARCHQGVAEDRENLLPTMSSCFSCHQHEGMWTSRQCDTCHVDLIAEQSRPASHVVHDIDFIDTHGDYAASQTDLCRTCHTETSCAQCHGVNVLALPATLRFDTPNIQNFHRAGFRSRHSLEAKADPGLCTTCHATSSCQSCHEEKGLAATGTPRGSPHPVRGWVGPRTDDNAHGPAARRDPLGCASCHSGAGEQLCVNCHKVGGIGGNVHPPNFSSALDQRTDAPCRDCHAP